jgi:hypothetical protein
MKIKIMFKIKFTEEADGQFLNLRQSKDKKVQFKAVGKALAYMNAHLRHPSLKTHKFDGIQSPFGGDVFGLWKQFKLNELTRERLQEQAKPYLDAIKSALRVGASAAGLTSKMGALCYDLLDRFPTLWTFLYEEGGRAYQ